MTAIPTDEDLKAAARVCYGILNGTLKPPRYKGMSYTDVMDMYLSLSARVYNYRWCKDLTENELGIFRALVRNYLPTLH